MNKQISYSKLIVTPCGCHSVVTNAWMVSFDFVIIGFLIFSFLTHCEADHVMCNASCILVGTVAMPILLELWVTIETLSPFTDSLKCTWHCHAQNVAFHLHLFANRLVLQCQACICFSY